MCRLLTDVDNSNALLYQALMVPKNVPLADGFENLTEAQVTEDSNNSTRDFVYRGQGYMTNLEPLQAAIDDGLASHVTGTTIEVIVQKGFARLT